MDKEKLKKYVEGKSTPGETKAFFDWLNADANNKKEFLSYRKLYDVSLWHESEETGRQKEVKRTTRKLLLEFAKIAAVFAIAFTSMYFIFLSHIPEEAVAMQTIYVPSGQRSQITLTDGTKVWLNAKTTFTFPNKFSKESREVQLDGEGYFDVVSNSKKPFIVKTNKYEVKAYGTEFNVIAYKEWDFFETALIKGVVNVVSNETSKTVKLLPNRRLYTDNDNLIATLIDIKGEDKVAREPVKQEEKLVNATIDHPGYFLWKDGLISFDQETVREILNKICLYFDVKIEVRNKSILQNKYTGKFWAKDGVEHVLKVLQLGNKFNYQLQDDQKTIVIK